MGFFKALGEAIVVMGEAAKEAREAQNKARARHLAIYTNQEVANDYEKLANDGYYLTTKQKEMIIDNLLESWGVKLTAEDLIRTNPEVAIAVATATTATTVAGTVWTNEEIQAFDNEYKLYRGDIDKMIRLKTSRLSKKSILDMKKRANEYKQAGI